MTGATQIDHQAPDSLGHLLEQLDRGFADLDPDFKPERLRRKSCYVLPRLRPSSLLLRHRAISSWCIRPGETSSFAAPNHSGCALIGRIDARPQTSSRPRLGKKRDWCHDDKPVILNLLRCLLLTFAVPVYAALRGRPLQKYRMRSVALLLPPLETLSFSPTLTPVHMNEQIDTLLSETRRFPPPRSIRGATPRLPMRCTTRGATGRSSGRTRRSALDWISPWSKVLEWRPPHARWFVDGKLNASANCLDRHLRSQAEQGRHHLGGRAGRPAGADVLGSGAGGRSLRQRAQEAWDPSGATGWPSICR